MDGRDLNMTLPISRIARDRSIDRLAPDYLAQWSTYYRKAYRLFVEGSISRVDANNALVSLGFRDSALKVELIELDRARARHIKARIKKGGEP